MTTTARSEGFTRHTLDAFPREPGRTYRLLEGAIVISAPAGLRRADRDALPPVGGRQELIDGEIVVNAAPNTRHQEIVLCLTIALSHACPKPMKVLLGPFDVVLADGVVLQPDLVVARRSDVTEKDLPTAPLLSVEVHSPSTRRLDLGRKNERLAEAGCPSYWVIEPGGGQVAPSLTAFELIDGRYVEVARVAGDDTWTAQRPFEVTIVPHQLLDD